MIPVSPTVPACLEEWARKAPRRPALISPRGELSFQQLEELSRRVARGLHGAGLRKGSRVIFMVRPGPEFLILAFALLRMGAVAVLVDPGLGLKNITRCLREVQAEGFIGIPLAQMARLCLGWLPKPRVSVTVGGWSTLPGLSWKGLLELGTRVSDYHPDVQEEDPAAVVFTSGSTGVPKGVLYTQKMFRAQARMLQEHFQIEPGEKDLATFPLFALFDPAMGVTAVLPRMDFSRPARVNPQEILGVIERHRVTHMFGSPALLQRLVDYASRQPRPVRLPSLKRVLSAGAPVPPRLVESFQALLRVGLVHTPYGATEALPICSLSSAQIPSARESAGKGVCVGFPLPGVQLRIIRLSDDPIPDWSRDLELPPGEIGELVVWGDMVSPCYVTRTEQNIFAKIRLPDGTCAHRMGDLGFQDEQGRIWLCGRKSQRVQTAAGTLYTLCCETLFNLHPLVSRSALVGIGAPPCQIPVLCVELRERVPQTLRPSLAEEILALGQGHPQAAGIRHLLFHPRFPVDVRHNAKIFREKLALWAAERIS